jgi:hypothetical protein
LQKNKINTSYKNVAPIILSLHIWFVFKVRSRSKGRKRKTKTQPTFVSWSAVFDYISWASQAVVFDSVTIAECKSAEPRNLLITGITNKHGLVFFFFFCQDNLEEAEAFRLLHRWRWQREMQPEQSIDANSFSTSS